MRQLLAKKMTETHFSKEEMSALKYICEIHPELPSDDILNEFILLLNGGETKILHKVGKKEYVVYDPLGLQEGVEVKETQASRLKSRETYATKANERQKLSLDIKSLLEDRYKGLIHEGDLTDREIFALSETLSRVPTHKWHAQKENLISSRSPSRLYEWAVANSSIVLPFLSLKTAGESMKDFALFNPSMSWGLKDGIFHLPKEESCSDSNLWTLIFDILSAQFGAENVIRDSDADMSVPSLDSDVVAQNTAINPVLIRILELFKSPASVTLRGVTQSENDRAIRNYVDFYVIDKYRGESSDDYSRMVYSPVVNNCRRTIMIPVTKQTPKGPVIENKPRNVGYMLSNLLLKYVDVTHSKNTPEGEPFVKFIFSILDTIVDQLVKNDDFVLPKSVFVDPASVLRVKIRKGPEISRKGKVAKSNLYIPFSFAKSSECSRMPETIRKELTSIGSNVLNNINQINHLPLEDQNTNFDFFEDYISISYNFSDEIRKQWRLEAKIVDPAILRTSLVNCFPSLDDLKSEDFRPSGYIAKCKKTKITFSPCIDIPAEQLILKNQLQEQLKNRMADRKKR